MPRAPTDGIDGTIISVSNDDQKTVIGDYDVVVINRGSSKGLKPGHVLAIWEAGEEVRDKSANADSRNVTLPEERIGLVMVFKTYDRMSYGLTMESSREVTAATKSARPRYRRTHPHGPRRRPRGRRFFRVQRVGRNPYCAQRGISRRCPRIHGTGICEWWLSARWMPKAMRREFDPYRMRCEVAGHNASPACGAPESGPSDEGKVAGSPGGAPRGACSGVEEKADNRQRVKNPRTGRRCPGGDSPVPA